MERRTFLLAGASLTSIFAGCASDSAGSDSDTTPETTDINTEGTTQQTTETDTETEESTPQNSSGSAGEEYQVRISYDGEWSGTLGTANSMRSVDGTGTKTFDISSSGSIVSANAQKSADDSGELTVEILRDGEVIAASSTSASYGVAQVTSEDGIDSGSNGTSSGTFEVKIEYSGSWQGSISAGGTSRSVDGTGDRTIPIEGNPDIISANAQKQDDSSDTLVIKILQEGEVVQKASTSADYGVAQVSYSNF